MEMEKKKKISNGWMDEKVHFSNNNRQTDVRNKGDLFSPSGPPKRMWGGGH